MSSAAAYTFIFLSGLSLAFALLAFWRSLRSLFAAAPGAKPEERGPEETEDRQVNP